MSSNSLALVFDGSAGVKTADECPEAGVSICSSAFMPLESGAVAIGVTFYGLPKRHVAYVFQHEGVIPDEPLVRIHSQCSTGESVGSLRCECKLQLKEAIERMKRSGGIILYMDDEGRGIGIDEKMKAYALQDLGCDTFAANRWLGHPEDARDHGVAAHMLQALGVNRARILTNNPDKVAALREHGIIVVETVPTGKYVNPYNEPYLRAKRELAGHTL